MSWTTSDDLRAQLQKAWDRGELLAALVTGAHSFPRRLTLKVPTSSEMAERFDDVRAWIAELRGLSHCRVEQREFRHRILGSNSIPHEAWVDSVDQAVSLLGKERPVAVFMKLLEETRAKQPKLLEWVTKKPLRVLELAKEWEKLLDVVSWIERHPRPGVYLRQVDLPGVHSKFIESHRGILADLLDVVLPPEQIDKSATGVSGFAARYGFLDKPARLRFRFLDPDHTMPPLDFPHDISLDAMSFANLRPSVSRIFITENETNYLAFPQVKESMILFGAGYGFAVLKRAEWLFSCHIYYWGDIDTHGFAILDQLRSQLPHVESFLMDRDTLLAFRNQWEEEDRPALRDLPRLTVEERALYDDLRDNRLGKKLRLEQEMISFGWVQSELEKI